jgi:hypothetical protein
MVTHAFSYAVADWELDRYVPRLSTSGSSMPTLSFVTLDNCDGSKSTLTLYWNGARFWFC